MLGKVDPSRLSKVVHAHRAFADVRKWSDLTLFDLIVIIENFPDAAWDVPLEFLPATVYDVIWPYCRDTAFIYIKRFLATQDAAWLRERQSRHFRSWRILHVSHSARVTC